MGFKFYCFKIYNKGIMVFFSYSVYFIFIIIWIYYEDIYTCTYVYKVINYNEWYNNDYRFFLGYNLKIMVNNCFKNRRLYILFEIWYNFFYLV